MGIDYPKKRKSLNTHCAICWDCLLNGTPTMFISGFLPLSQFDIVPFFALQIVKLYCSFTNASFFLLVTLSFVLFVFNLLFLFMLDLIDRHNHKKAIVELLKSETFLYFLLICWIFCTLFLFCWFYPLVVGEVAAGGLVNPLQVLVQLCAVIFFRDYPKKIYFLLLSLFGGSLFANLFLTGVENLYLYLFSLLFIFSFILLLGNKSYK